jgi:hypothetical protein
MDVCFVGSLSLEDELPDVKDRSSNLEFDAATDTTSYLDYSVKCDPIQN